MRDPGLLTAEQTLPQQSAFLCDNEYPLHLDNS